MDVLSDEIRAGLLDWPEVIRLSFRLVVATVLGAVIGYEREAAGKDAGLRTHMLVASGAALLVLAVQGAGMAIADQSRVIQGVVTGVGFLGAGAILKVDRARTVHGLTTAAGIWLTAAMGVAVGLGQLALALLATALGWVVLAGLRTLERRRVRNQDGLVVAPGAAAREPGPERTP